jgi:hypothetical protein
LASDRVVAGASSNVPPSPAHTTLSSSTGVIAPRAPGGAKLVLLGIATAVVVGFGVFALVAGSRREDARSVRPAAAVQRAPSERQLDSAPTPAGPPSLATPPTGATSQPTATREPVGPAAAAVMQPAAAKAASSPSRPPATPDASVQAATTARSTATAPRPVEPRPMADAASAAVPSNGGPNAPSTTPRASTMKPGSGVAPSRRTIPGRGVSDTNGDSGQDFDPNAVGGEEE